VKYVYKYKMMARELTVVEKWVAWENVLDLRSRARSALDYKYRMNLYRRQGRAGGGHLRSDDGLFDVGRVIIERR